MNARLKPMKPIVDRAKWLAARRRGIGGSDAAAVVGVSQWATPLDVYLDKLALAPEREDSPSMAWGRALEPVIRQAYSDRTGYAVQTPDMLAHPQHDWMLANLDGIADDGRRVLEIKTARTAKDWGDEGSDHIPLPYLLQVQHYMAVTELDVADVAVLIGGSDFRIYQVPADAELQAGLIEQEAELWDRIQRRDPPDPVTFAEVRQRFGRSDAAGVIDADAATFGKALTLQGITQEINALAERADECRAALMRALGEHGDTLMHGGNVIATWKLAKAPQRFDAKAFRAEHADLYTQFTRPVQPSRRLLLKHLED